MKNKIFVTLIAVSLVLCWWSQMRWFALNNTNNTGMFLNVMEMVGPAGPHFKPEWDMRIVPRLLARATCAAMNPQNDEQFRDAFGAYQALWVALVFAAIIRYTADPLLPVLLVFAGLEVSKMTPEMVPAALPWDLSTLFVWTIITIAWYRGAHNWLVLFVILGTLIGKETVAVAAFLIFFTRLGWHEQLADFVTMFVGCLVVRLVLTTIMSGHPHVFILAKSGDLNTNLHQLLHFEFSTQLRAPFLIVNAGLMLLLFFTPLKSAEDWGVKVVCLLFFIGQTISTASDSLYFYEFREWTDLLPLTIFYLQPKLSCART